MKSRHQETWKSRNQETKKSRKGGTKKSRKTGIQEPGNMEKQKPRNKESYKKNTDYFKKQLGSFNNTIDMNKRKSHVRIKSLNMKPPQPYYKHSSLLTPTNVDNKVNESGAYTAQ